MLCDIARWNRQNSEQTFIVQCSIYIFPIILCYCKFWWMSLLHHCYYNIKVVTMWYKASYAPSQYQFGSDVTSASNWSRGRGPTLTRAVRRNACCIYREQVLILFDVTTKLLVTWIVSSLLKDYNSVISVEITVITQYRK